MRNEDEEAKCNLTASRFCGKVEGLKNGDHEDLDGVPEQKCLGGCPCTDGSVSICAVQYDGQQAHMTTEKLNLA